MDTTTQLGSALVGDRLVPLDQATLAITDDGAVRGDGAFETLGVWSGRPFQVPAHLERLNRSLRGIGLPPADEVVLADRIARLCDGLGDRNAMVRVYVTAAGTQVVTLADQPVRAAARHLVPQPAPWVRPLGTYQPAGAKTMSYGPNMAATRAAQRAGGDDALLMSLEGIALEGPTFAVLWVSDGVLHAPDLALGIVDSISRRVVLGLAAEAGVAVRTGRWGLEAVTGADEVMVCSSVRPLLAVHRVGDHPVPTTTPVCDTLAEALAGARHDG